MDALEGIRVGDTVRRAWAGAAKAAVTALRELPDGTEVADLLLPTGNTQFAYQVDGLVFVARTAEALPTRPCRRPHADLPCIRCEHADELTLPHTNLMVPFTPLRVVSRRGGELQYTAVLALDGQPVGTIEYDLCVGYAEYRPNPGSPVTVAQVDRFADQSVLEDGTTPTTAHVLDRLVEEWFGQTLVKAATRRGIGLARYHCAWGDEHHSLPSTPDDTDEALLAAARIVYPRTPHSNGVWQAWTKSQRWQVLPDPAGD
ncbi:hypothetical protein [Micromonospora sp. CPCC 206061]|uniref:hypothetical protein n=1 Tax=Micromonospora sp. CPCC 206061 TaxID=3122410 RepID=UPI002FEEE10B